MPLIVAGAVAVVALADDSNEKMVQDAKDFEARLKSDLSKKKEEVQCLTREINAIGTEETRLMLELDETNMKRMSNEDELCELKTLTVQAADEEASLSTTLEDVNRKLNQISSLKVGLGSMPRLVASMPERSEMYRNSVIEVMESIPKSINM